MCLPDRAVNKDRQNRGQWRCRSSEYLRASPTKSAEGTWREPFRVRPGRCGPLGGLLLPALAPIQQVKVPTQISVNGCSRSTCSPAHSWAALHASVFRALQPIRCPNAPPLHHLSGSGLKALEPAPDLPLTLPQFSCPPLVLRRGLPLPRLCLMSERLEPDLTRGTGPHSSGFTQPPTPAPALGGWGRKERPRHPPDRRSLSPQRGGRLGAGTVLCAPPPGRSLGGHLPNSPGAAARPIEPIGGARPHVAWAAAPPPPDPSHLGRGVDRLPRADLLAKYQLWIRPSRRPTDTGRRRKVPPHCPKFVTPPPPGASQSPGLPGRPWTRVQTRTRAPHNGLWPAACLRRSSDSRRASQGPRTS
ncbi:hypothetical protein NDU88_002341 [Pleurodeles waltl]|uniref:Basic proline-rich protein-like n=1 Tax=Pleurodeles waltl TaxID=8319 RepID=A0AAV7SDE2_PLEWA|nr:hypothetical protein NDU88_002341 [Pleurodeles waltl]